MSSVQGWAVVGPEGKVLTQYPLEGGEVLAYAIKADNCVMETDCDGHGASVKPVTIATECNCGRKPSIRIPVGHGETRTWTFNFCPDCGGKVVVDE